LTEDQPYVCGEKYIPIVRVMQKPLIASPYLDYVPSNCGVLTDENSWILDFGEISTIYGVEFSRMGMRYFKPTQCDRASAITESNRMAACLKARFLGIELHAEPIKAADLANEIYGYMSQSWQLLLSASPEPPNRNRNRQIIKDIPEFPNGWFRGYFIPRFFDIIENMNADLRSFVRFKSFNRHYGLGSKSHEFLVEIHFGIFQSEMYGSGSPEWLKGIKEKLNVFFLQLTCAYSRPFQLQVIQCPVKCWNIEQVVLNQDYFIPCTKVNSSKGDCPFPAELQIPASFACPGEIYTATPKSARPEDYVEFGLKLNYGVPSLLKGTHLIDAFTQHAAIFGTTGMGKTTFFLQLTDQINAKRPDVGILIINLAKSNQGPLFGSRVDQVIFYGDDLCHIPYYVEMPIAKEYALRNPHEALSVTAVGLTAAMITAGLGLGNPVDSILTILLEQFQQSDTIPETIQTFLDAFDEYLERHPYGRDYQPNLRQYFANRKLALADPTLIKTMTYYARQIPLWFQWWREGKSIMLDLSPCQDKRRQRFLMFGILNLIRVLTVNDNNPRQKLKSLVFIDEAKRFLATSAGHDPHDDEAQSLNMTREMISQTMAEARERGIGFVNADTSPGDLIESVWKIPALKICFSLNGKEASLLTENPHLPQHIEALRKYQALVINTTSGEKYMIQTQPPTPVARPDRLPAAEAEWWVYQKAINDPDYVNPAIFENHLEEALSTHIAKDFKENRFLNIARVSHCLANNGIRVILAEITDFPRNKLTKNPAKLWETLDAVIDHFGDLGEITSVPEWAWDRLPPTVQTELQTGHRSVTRIIYKTTDIEIKHLVATLTQIDRWVLDPARGGLGGESLVLLVAIHNHMLCRLLYNLSIEFTGGSRMFYDSLLTTMKNAGVWVPHIPDSLLAYKSRAKERKDSAPKPTPSPSPSPAGGLHHV
jgi:hypothetical protein